MHTCRESPQPRESIRQLLIWREHPGHTACRLRGRLTCESLGMSESSRGSAALQLDDLTVPRDALEILTFGRKFCFFSVSNCAKRRLAL